MKSKAPQDRITALGKKLFELKARKKVLEDEVSKVNEAIKEIAEVELASLMADADVEKQTIKGAGTIYLSDVFYASVLKDDRPALYDWLRANGHKDIIVDYIHPQTLTAWCKEQYFNAEPLPDVIKATVIQTVKTRSS